VQSPVVTLDDPVGDMRKHKEFELRLKQIVANGTWRCEVKFRAAHDVPWCGRIPMSCNNDPISMGILPGLSSSNRDKVIILKCGDHPVKFHRSLDENKSVIDRELPHFGRWLLDWTPPPHSQSNDNRYGVTAYHHPDLVQTINDSGLVGTITSILELTFRNAPPNRDGEHCWEGTAVELYELLCASAKNSMSGLKVSSIATCLTIMKQRGYNIGGELLRGHHKVTRWKIPHDISKLSEPETKGEEKP
jgi:hypothetical protein